jgi:hypothetical protein
MPDPAVLRAQCERLESEILQHKARIRQSKSRLKVAASALESITKLLRETEQSATVGAEGNDLHGQHTERSEP